VPREAANEDFRHGEKDGKRRGKGCWVEERRRERGNKILVGCEDPGGPRLK
jgi:hypothetical protein